MITANPFPLNPDTNCPLFSLGAMYSDWWASPEGTRKAETPERDSSARTEARRAVLSNLRGERDQKVKICLIQI